MHTQTWNDVLSYVKLNLGGSKNLIELSDEELVENYRDHVLPSFSRYLPLHKYTKITRENLVFSGGPNYNQYGFGEMSRFRYKLPLPENEVVFNIYELILRSDTENLNLDEFGYIEAAANNIIDVAIFNTYSDIYRYIRQRRTWVFFPPDMIELDFNPRTGAIVIYTTVHDSPEYIQADQYIATFKPLCLAYTKKWLGSIRTKFESVSTAFGEIRLNGAKLEQEAQQELETIYQKLENLPPDKVLDFGEF